MGENASHIPKSYGGGMFGHLGLVTQTNAYFTLAGVQFVIPQDPGTYDICISIHVTAGKCIHMKKEHENRKQE